MNAIKLTDQQIENWRRVLSNQYGDVIAQGLTKEEIQKYYEQMQGLINIYRKGGGRWEKRLMDSFGTG